MGEDGEVQVGAEEFEEFPEYGRETLREHRIVAFVCGSVLAVFYLIIILGMRPSRTLSLLAGLSWGLMTLSVFFYQPNRMTRLSSRGIGSAKGKLYPWGRVTWLRRMSASTWFTAKPLEVLDVFIAPEERTTTRSHFIFGRTRQSESRGMRQFTFTNTPEAIELVINAMERYSGRNLRSLMNEEPV